MFSEGQNKSCMMKIARGLEMFEIEAFFQWNNAKNANLSLVDNKGFLLRKSKIAFSGRFIMISAFSCHISGF